MEAFGGDQSLNDPGEVDNLNEQVPLEMLPANSIP